MGSDRHLGKKDPNRQNFWDDDVCKNHLVWECPNSMFVNQAGKIAPNSPLGECKRKHAEAMIARLKEDNDYKKYRCQYLKETKHVYKKLLDELDKKRDRDKEKLHKNSTKDAQDFVKEQVEKRQIIVKEKLEEADRKAANGELQVTQSVFEEACYLTDEQVRLEKLKETTEKWCDEICEVCGQLICWREEEELRHKAEGRPHPHYMGAVCTGWGRIRNSYGKLEEKLRKIGAVDDPVGEEKEIDKEKSCDTEETKGKEKDEQDRKENGQREDRGRGSDRGSREPSRGRRGDEGRRRDRSRGRDSRDKGKDSRDGGGDRSRRRDSRDKGRSRDRTQDSKHERRGKDRDGNRRRDRSRSRRDRSRS